MNEAQLRGAECVVCHRSLGVGTGSPQSCESCWRNEHLRIEPYRAVLCELVALKKMKDDLERWVRDEATGEQWPEMQPMSRREEVSAEYQRRKPLAWAAAFALIEDKTWNG